MKTIDHIKVAKNLIFSGISEGSNVFLFLLMILAARFLGDTDFGMYCFAFAYVSLFQLFSDWGLTYASSVEIARDRSKGKFYLGNILGFQTISCIILFFLITLIARFMNITSTVRNLIYLQTLIMIIRSYKLTFRWLMKAHERFDLESLTLIIERSAIFIIGVYVLVKGYGLYAFILTFLFVRLIDVFITAMLTWKKVTGALPKFNVGLWWSMIKKGLPFVISYTLIYIFFQIDTVMLGIMRTVQEVGWYNAPFRILEGLLVVPSIVSFALMPTLSQAHIISSETVTSIYRRGCKYLVLMAIPLISTGVVLAKKIIPLIFGPEYLPSVFILQLLIPSLFFLFISNFGAIVLTCIDRQKAVIWNAGICVILNIVLNYILIPFYGAIGAAVATLITEAVFFLLINFYLIKHRYSFNWIKLLIKPCIAAIILLIAQVFFLILPLWAFLLASLILYLLLLFFMNIIDEKEKAIIGNIIKPISRFFQKNT